MKIKRTQKIGNIQFEDVSHFNNESAATPKDALLKIMLDRANEKLKMADKAFSRQA